MTPFLHSGLSFETAFREVTCNKDAIDLRSLSLTSTYQAGGVGTNLAVQPTATGQQVVKQNPTGILSAPPLTASNMAPNPNSHTAKDGLSTGTSHLLIAAGSIGNGIDTNCMQ